MSRLEQSPSGDGSLEHREYLTVQADLIPLALKEYPRPQWVCWRKVFRGEGKKPDKRPINPKTLGNAGPHWPNSWSDFHSAYASYLQHRTLDDPRHLDGVGFFLTVDDPYVAVDLDNCVTDEGITQPARDIIQELNSYTERSPSGHGIRILVSSPKPIDNFKSPELEIYTHNRYVTLTGHVTGAPVMIAEVDPSILQSLRPPQAPVAIPTPHESKPFTGTDAQLWEQIFCYDKFGAQHQQRFNGDISLDHGDHSLVVIRLLNALARWSGGDAARMRSMMLTSPLATAKWFTKRGKGDWLDYQIADAIRYVKGGK